jgi:hypothetical protein
MISDQLLVRKMLPVSAQCALLSAEAAHHLLVLLMTDDQQ